MGKVLTWASLQFTLSEQDRKKTNKRPVKADALVFHLPEIPISGQLEFLIGIWMDPKETINRPV